MFKCISPVNKQVVHEQVSMVYEKKKKLVNILLVCAALYFVYCFISGWEPNPAQMALEAGIYVVGEIILIVVCTLLYKWGMKRSEEMSLKRIETLNLSKNIDVKIEILEDRIIAIKDEDADASNEDSKKPMLYLKDVKSVATTEHYIMIGFEGKIYLAIEPDSIEGGTKEELIAHIKKASGKFKG